MITLYFSFLQTVVFINTNFFQIGNLTLPKKFHTVKTMVFPLVMYRCESWTIKKAEC